MADTSKPILSPTDPSAIFSDQDSRHSASSSPSRGFIAVDIGSVSMIASDEMEPTAAGCQPLSLGRSISRKGSQRGSGGGAAEGDAAATPTGGPGSGERMAPLHVHVAGVGEHSRPVHTPSPAEAAGGNFRRLGRRPAPRLDPRRVLLVFATLSSMGTLILLYFTLSMSKTAGRDTDAQ